MAFSISGLEPTLFTGLFRRSDADLARDNIAVVYADDDDYPCRISLCSADRGDRLLLLNHVHQPASSPYHSAHAVYIAQRSNRRGVFVDTIPPIMISRLLSIRAFDEQHMMIDADVVDGVNAAPLIQRLLQDRRAAYLHVHFAKRGCFAATVVREG